MQLAKIFYFHKACYWILLGGLEEIGYFCAIY